jgi:predicted nucleic acid-binding protein
VVLIDSDVFVLDLFYRQDPRSSVNRRLIDLSAPAKATTIFNVLEVCGVASFRKTAEEIKRLFQEFHQVYNLSILYPTGRAGDEDVVPRMVAGTFTRVLKKMDFSDALILATAESRGVSRIVTWNTKHFDGRTSLPVMTPEAFLDQEAGQE